MNVQDRVKAALDAGDLEYNKEYRAEDLGIVWQKRKYPQTFHQMFTNATAEKAGAYAGFSVVPEGGKRTRTYRFRDTTTPPIEETNEETNNSEDEGAPPTTSARTFNKNDHPEDRQHIAAHVAWYLHRGCVAISMPKTTGSRGLTETGTHEHPDMIGVVTSRPVQRGGVEVPRWMARPDRDKKVPETLVLAAEVKHEISAISALFEAIREARHNTRYFDEGWLLADIREALHSQARDLAEEYNVGVLSTSSRSMKSAVLWTPRHAARMRGPEDYFSRFAGPKSESADSHISRLSSCKALADELAGVGTKNPSANILEQMFTSQDRQSLVERLPKSISESLLKARSGEASAQADVREYAEVFFLVFERAYLDSPDDDGMLDFYRRNVGRLNKNALLTADYFGEAAKVEIRAAFAKNLEQEHQDIKAMLDANIIGS